MDQIEFRPMNNGIQTTGSAVLTEAGAQGKTGCGRGSDDGCYGGRGDDNGCYGSRGGDNGYYGGHGDDNGCYGGRGDDNGKYKDKDNGYRSGYGNGNGNGNGNCNTQTTETGSDGHIYYRGCEEAKIKIMPDRELDQTGRVLDITMTLRNVCPCRHVSVGYQVTELDDDNNEYARGFKAFTVEPHYNARACDMELDSVRFILPDDARVGNGARHFVVRADAHYADTAVTMR